MKQPSDKRLVNATIDAYVEWWQQCLGVRDAYASWTKAPAAAAASAFARYTGALDQEQRAADAYAGLARRVAA